MENFLFGIAGAALSGITYIAYKHPELYEKEFSPKILYVALGVLFSSLIFDTGVTAAHTELLPLLKDNIGTEVQLALEKAKTPSYMYASALGALLYGGFLSWLANHMKTEYAKKKAN